MNKNYRLIRSELTQVWVAVSEITRSRGKRTSATISAVTLATASWIALAAPPTPPQAKQLPTGGQVVAGQASTAQSGAVMNITQTTNRAAIDWQTFNIGSQAQVHFQQPSASSATLNRVLDPNPSQIFGRLTANGQVFLTNPSGIYFGRSASVDVGGLVATTHNIGTTDFMAGKSVFSRNGATGSVINEGNLQAQLGGYIALLAPEVRNQGVVIARLGTVALAAGESYELEFADETRLTGIRVSPSTLKALVDNAHAIEAPEGLVILSARAVEELQGGIVRHSGSVEASSLTAKGGRILLEGDDIHLATGSKLNASGANGGGEVLVGGDWQGRGNLKSATSVSMEQDATIDVSATKVGAGGTAVLWSDVSNPQSKTVVDGTLLAKGGPEGGDGGRIETSGALLRVDEHAVVNTLASQGHAGLWLIDPTNFTISAGGAAQTTSSIGATTLSTNLSTSSVLIQTDAAGSQNGDITVSSAVTKTSGAATTLTLAADQNVLVNAGISGAAGSPLNVVLASRARGGATGAVNVAASIRSFGGDITIGGGDTQASGYAVANGSAISTNSAGVYVGVTANGVVDATGDGSGAANATMPTAVSGGNIVIRGSGSSTAAQSNMGIYVSQEGTGTGSIVTGGSGSITLDGVGGNGNAFWSISSSGILLGLNAYIKANLGNLTLKGTAGTGSDRHGIAATSNKLIGTQGGHISIEGDSLLIRDGTLTINAGADSDIKAPIVGCTGGGSGSSGCSTYGLTKTGSGILTLSGNAQAWSATPPANTRISATNGTFTDAGNAVNVSSPLTAGSALYAFGIRPTTVTVVGGGNSITISLLGSTSKIYGDSNPVLALGTQYSITGCTGCVTLDWGSFMTRTTPAGSYSYGNGISVGTSDLFSLSYLTGSSSDYSVTWNYGAGLSSTVNLRPLNLSVSKPYDSSTRFDSGFILSGIVNNDAIPSMTGTANVASANAATYNSFTSSTLALNNANYTLTGGSVTATINPATLTAITGDLTGTVSKIYDGTTSATLSPGNFLLTGWVSSDSATVTKTSGSYDNANAGTNKTVTVSLANSDYSASGATLLANYSLPTTISGAVGTISKAPLTVTANNASKTYDGLTYSGGNGVSYSGFVAGQTAGVLSGALTYGGTAQGAINAGSYYIIPGELASNNYSVTFVDGLLTIGQAALTAITGNLTGTVSKVYDGTTSATLSPGNFLLTGWVSSDSATVTKTSGSYDNANAGTNKTVTVSLTSGDYSATGSTMLTNYSLPTTISGSVGAINRAPATVRGFDQNIFVINARLSVGWPLPISVSVGDYLRLFHVTGLVNGERDNVIAPFIDARFAVAAAENIRPIARLLNGPYQFATEDHFPAGNYDVHYIPGTLMKRGNFDPTESSSFQQTKLSRLPSLPARTATQSLIDAPIETFEIKTASTTPTTQALDKQQSWDAAQKEYYQAYETTLINEIEKKRLVSKNKSGDSKLAADVQKLYVAYFNRPADPLGLSVWLDAVKTSGGNDGASLSAIASSFSASAEYQATYAGLNADQIVKKVYENLFGHPPDPADLGYWSQKLSTGTFSLGPMITTITDSAQGMDATVMNNKVTAADIFTNSVDSTREIVGYSGAEAGKLAKAWLSHITNGETLPSATSPSTLDFRIIDTLIHINDIESKLLVSDGRPFLKQIEAQMVEMKPPIFAKYGIEGDAVNAGTNPFVAPEANSGKRGTASPVVVATGGSIEHNGNEPLHVVCQGNCQFTGTGPIIIDVIPNGATITNNGTGTIIVTVVPSSVSLKGPGLITIKKASSTTITNELSQGQIIIEDGSNLSIGGTGNTNIVTLNGSLISNSSGSISVLNFDASTGTGAITNYGTGTINVDSLPPNFKTNFSGSGSITISNANDTAITNNLTNPGQITIQDGRHLTLGGNGNINIVTLTGTLTNNGSGTLIIGNPKDDGSNSLVVAGIGNTTIVGGPESASIINILNDDGTTSTKNPDQHQDGGKPVVGDFSISIAGTVVWNKSGTEEKPILIFQKGSGPIHLINVSNSLISGKGKGSVTIENVTGDLILEGSHPLAIKTLLNGTITNFGTQNVIVSNPPLTIKPGELVTQTLQQTKELRTSLKILKAKVSKPPSPEKIRKMSSSQIKRRNASEIRGMQKEHIQALGIKHLRRMSKKQIGAFSQKQLGWMSESELRFLLTEKRQSLSENQRVFITSVR